MNAIKNPHPLKSKCFLIFVFTALFFPICSIVHGQTGAKMFRVGELLFRDGTRMGPGRQAFRRQLHDLGYIEGKNILYETRSAKGHIERFHELAAELVRLNVDVVFASSTNEALAFKAVTKTIPIVFHVTSDPIEDGLVQSLARPGGNITGLSNFAPELSGKRLELLKEIIPSLSRVAVFGTSNVPGAAQMLKQTELTAAAFGVKVHYLDVQDPKDIDTAFRAASKARFEAILWTVAGSVASFQRKEIAEHAVKSRIPTIYELPTYVEGGGLMSYGVNLYDLDRRAATYVDKLLKGAKPADLPVEQPTKFELIINLKTAKQIGLTIPPNVLARADRVIR